jgi:hypothetical protein
MIEPIPKHLCEFISIAAMSFDGFVHEREQAGHAEGTRLGPKSFARKKIRRVTALATWRVILVCAGVI